LRHTNNNKACIAVIFFVVAACPAMAEEPVEPSAQAAEATQEQRFDVLEFRVSGNTLLEVKDLERTLYSYLGRDKAFADIELARKALEQRYRDEGFPAVLVDIPEQRVDAGVVWLKVTESKIASLRVSGARYYSSRRLAEQVSALEPGNRLQFAVVQEQISLAGAAYPDRGINPVLRPGRTPGTVEAELKVQDRLPLFGSVEINDRYGENTHRWRSSASVGYSNLWQRGHSLNIQYQTAPEEPAEVRVWSGTYLFRVPSRQSLVALYAVNSKSDVAALGDLSVLGDGNIAGARWISPWRDDDQTSRSLSLGIDYKDFKENIVVQGADTSETPISYLSFGIDFTSTHSEADKNTSLNIGTGFGVRGLGNTSREFDDKRFSARPNYIVLRAGAEHDRPLYFRTRLHLELEGQLADSPLISNEQYAAGGSDTVRGYHESQQMGDDAVRARAEWHSPPLLGASAMPDQSFHGLLFWDGAALHVQEAGAGQDAHTRLASVGVGLRMSETPAWEAQMDLARALVDAGSVQHGDMRWHAYFKYQF
jgi:hemolysin activation/secretion protein